MQQLNVTFVMVRLFVIFAIAFFSMVSPIFAYPYTEVKTLSSGWYFFEREYICYSAPHIQTKVAQEKFEWFGLIHIKRGYIPDGPCKSYFDNGNLFQVIYYKNNVAHGSMKSFHKNGELAASGNYVENKMNGRFQFFTDDGKFDYEAHYADDELLQTYEMDTNGNLVLRHDYKKSPLSPPKENNESNFWIPDVIATRFYIDLEYSPDEFATSPYISFETINKYKWMVGIGFGGDQWQGQGLLSGAGVLGYQFFYDSLLLPYIKLKVSGGEISYNDQITFTRVNQLGFGCKLWEIDRLKFSIEYQHQWVSLEPLADTENNRIVFTVSWALANIMGQFLP